jgi:hypothetical protein
METFEDVIPINYMGGSGGHFLSSWITYAKYNFSEYRLSENSNAHDNLKECEWENPDQGMYFINMTWEEQLKFLQSLQIVPQWNKMLGGKLNKPYFFPVHSKYQKYLVEAFNKVITITYEEKDIEDIAKVYAVKRGIDLLNQNASFTRSLYKQQKLALLDHIQIYQNHDVVNCLYISWEKLINLPYDDLADKISNFLDIKNLYFSIDFLENWRIGTKKCIEVYDNQIRITH